MEKRQGSRLPHWRLDGGAYFVTYRLGDSLPSEVVKAYEADLADRLQIHRGLLGRELHPWEAAEIRRKCIGKVERFLDTGHGACFLREPAVADEAQRVMLADETVNLMAWVVMPNHVHAVVHTPSGLDLSDVLQTWKSVSAHNINKALGRQGKFWQKESFDHVIRTPLKLQKFVAYVLENPRKAHLENWRWVGSKTPNLGEIRWPT